MYTPVEVDGQLYSNRVRKNIAKIMQQRGMSGNRGLPNMTGAGLFRFLSGGCDITMTRAQLLADDLGVTLNELIANPDLR